MIGAMWSYGAFFIYVVAVAATLCFGIPYLFFPIQYGKLCGWKIPDDQNFLLYTCRAFGGVILVLAYAGAKAAGNDQWRPFFAHQLTVLFVAMFLVHAYSWMKKSSTPVMNGICVFWAVMSICALLFGPPSLG